MQGNDHTGCWGGMSLDNSKPSASLLTLSKAISFLIEGFFPLKYLKWKQLGKQHDQHRLLHASPLPRAQQLLWHPLHWRVSFPRRTGRRDTDLTPVPSPASPCLLAPRHALLPSCCPSCLPLFPKARAVSSSLALFLLWLEEQGMGREPYLDKDSIKD